MPRRQSTKRVETDELQGEGSYVVVRGLPWRIVKQARAAQLAPADEVSTLEAEFTEQIITELVVEWNWVDDDGEPLTVPSEDAMVIDELTTDEVMFLVGLVSGGGAAAKN